MIETQRCQADLEAEFFPAHYQCDICAPPTFPSLALCGAELLGIGVEPNAPHCESCDELIADHVMKHFYSD